jgi:hypothetical protein
MLCPLSGCSKEKSADKAHQIDSKEPVKTSTQENQYTNDIDRLNQIANRLNRAFGGNYATIFGTDDETNGPLIAVDYALFDRLSDDGVAAMVAEGMIKKASLTNSALASNNPPNDIVKADEVLTVDETVGRCLAKAGFSSNGFSQWLNSQGLSVAGPDLVGISANMRTKAFMQGFLSISGSQTGK